MVESRATLHFYVACVHCFGAFLEETSTDSALGIIQFGTYDSMTTDDRRTAGVRPLGSFGFVGLPPPAAVPVTSTETKGAWMGTARGWIVLGPR